MDALTSSLIVSRLRQLMEQIDLFARQQGGGAASCRHVLCDGDDPLVAADHPLTGTPFVFVRWDGSRLACIRGEEPGIRRDALELGSWQLGRLTAGWSSDAIIAAIAELRRLNAMATQAVIEALPQGRWTAEDWLDSDGIVDRPLRIAVELENRDGRLRLDFGQTSAAAGGAVNLSAAMTRMACDQALRSASVVEPLFAVSSGKIDLVIPEGCLLSAEPLDCTGHGFQRVVDVVTAVLAKATPTSSLHAAPGAASAVRLGTRGAATFSFPGGGGACSSRDGSDCLDARRQWLCSSSIEILERELPVMFVLSSARTDSGGAGLRRGGVGTTHELEVLDVEAEASLLGERGKYGPPGLAGGRPGSGLRLAWWDGGVACDPPMISRLDGLHLTRGQRLRLETAGGGGYGRARQRSPQDVSFDVRNGYVSYGAARRDYAVEVDRSGVLDMEATRKLRGQA